MSVGNCSDLGTTTHSPIHGGAHNHSNGLSGGAIVGIAIGGVLLLAVGGFLVYRRIIKKKTAKNGKNNGSVKKRIAKMKKNGNVMKKPKLILIE